MERIRPERLRAGDRIAIITPAAPVKREYVEKAVEKMERERGLRPVVMGHALAEPDGYFASKASDRLADFKAAWEDPEIKAILCSRGGYGSVHLAPGIDRILAESRRKGLKPKWLTGFSDITVFHSVFSRHGIESIHGPMAKNIATTPNESVETLFHILLDNEKPAYEIPGHLYNREGKARGILTGGNAATIHGLAATPFDPLRENDGEKKILFLEDVGENIYEINRMLWRMGLSGELNKLSGIVVGQFTLYEPDHSFETMEEMIDATLREFETECPVIFNFQAGHIDNNLPLIMGSPVEIEADRGRAVLRHT